MVAVAGTLEIMGAVFAAPVTVKVPGPVALSVDPVLLARTVKRVLPAGVPLVVVIVKVDVLEYGEGPIPTELGEKENVAPVGKGVVMVKSAVKVFPPPPRVTVTRYVTLPAVPEVSVPT
jgi:hypothetical protein